MPAFADSTQPRGIVDKFKINCFHSFSFLQILPSVLARDGGHCLVSSVLSVIIKMNSNAKMRNRSRTYFYRWPKSEEVHTNGFRTPGGRWRASTRAHSIRTLFITFYGFCMKGKYFFKNHRGNSELEENCKGWSSRWRRNSWLALRQLFPFYHLSSSLHFDLFLCGGNRIYLHSLARSVRFTLSQGLDRN